MGATYFHIVVRYQRKKEPLTEEPYLAPHSLRL